MRVLPRRGKGRPDDGGDARPEPPTAPQQRVPVEEPPPDASRRDSEADTVRMSAAEVLGQEELTSEGWVPAGPPPAWPPPPSSTRSAAPAPTEPSSQSSPSTGSSAGTTAARRAVSGVSDADRKRRARAAERQRAAAEVKRSRAGLRRGRRDRRAAAAAEHRSALLVMVLTLGLLIASVAVTGTMIATSMRTRPVALAAPLHVYPVTQTTPGPCPAGAAGINGQAASGPACYRLAQGIAIREVADLRVQRSRVTSGYDVAVTLRAADRKAFARLTRATVGRDLAFVVRERLITLPRVDMPILDGKVVVTGPPDRAAADRLYRELKGS
ncbi:SecDF P1 head subdomain-containing protein [Spirillospora albida]|uniref:SecDF P1 head subdomain-containing protein n=1 Tax=Spirillospora albida TaxID=58123 RepID=UPI00068BD162|nr:hypothetical protein [Spirillospora albida]